MSTKGTAYRDVHAAIAEANASLSAALDPPEVVYEHAPGAYIAKVLPELRDAIEQLESIRRATVDEALAGRLLTQRELAQLAGIGSATANRWARARRQSESSTAGGDDGG